MDSDGSEADSSPESACHGTNVTNLLVIFENLVLIKSQTALIHTLVASLGVGPFLLLTRDLPFRSRLVDEMEAVVPFTWPTLKCRPFYADCSHEIL